MTIEKTPTNITAFDMLDSAGEYASRLLDIDASNTVALNCLSPVSSPSSISYISPWSKVNNAEPSTSRPHIENEQLEEGYKSLLQEATFLLE